MIRRLLEQTGLNDAQVDELIFGQVLTAGAGQNPARQSLIKADLPYAVPALTLSKVCGSGLKALHLGAQAIRCGDAEVIIAGGLHRVGRSSNRVSTSDAATPPRKFSASSPSAVRLLMPSSN